MPSMMFDSTGTKKIAAIASYVIEALEQGRILVVDEMCIRDRNNGLKCRKPVFMRVSGICFIKRL